MKLPTSIVALGTALFTSGASALSLGGSLGGAVLGRPLDVRFQIQPDAGQVDQALCPTAQVVQGDGSLGVTPSTVVLQSAADRAGQLLLARVRTHAHIQEPVVMVQVSVGCAGTVRRSYTFLADLPESPAIAFQDSSVRVRPLALESISSGSTDAKQQPLLRDSVPKPMPVVRHPAKVRKHLPTLTAAPEMEPTSAPASVAVPAPVPAPRPAPAPVPVPVPVPARAPVQPPPSDRLVMEPMGALPEAAARASATALPKSEGEPGASEAPTLPLLAESERQAKELLQLQTEMAALRTHLQEMRVANAQLQKQLEQAQQQAQPQGFSATVVYMLLGLLALALAGALWFWKRVRGAASSQEQDSLFAPPETNVQQPAAWASATTTLPSSFLSEQEPDQDQDQDSVTLNEVNPEALPETRDVVLTLPEEETQTTAPVLPTAMAETVAPVEAKPTRRVINPEAIFDLQQRAEFFISVGENDQAIGVMKQHIAENETSSPLAYLELLRLYHSLGRIEEFSQLRNQFHQHFNACVPEFAEFSQTGHSLLGYVEVLARIEAQWNSQDVLAELAHCLFQRDSDTPVFDLNAYDDLMLLYAIAQTTPPHARGLPLPRTRTTPQENETDDADPLAEDVKKKGVMLSLPPDLNWTPPPLPAPAPVPSVEPEPLPTSLSMDDFSWAPPSQDLNAPAIEPLPELAPELVIVPAPAPVASARRISMDGEEFDLDFTLPEGLEQELMALAAPQVVSPPAKAPVDSDDYSIHFDIGPELAKRPASAHKPAG